MFKYTEEELLEKILDNNEFPISSSKVNLQNKKLDYSTYMLITLLSNRQLDKDVEETGIEETWRYLYRNKLKYYQGLVEELSNAKLNTIFKTIKKMEKLDCKVINVRKTEANEIVYDINYKTNNREYVTIDTNIMKALINVFNSNAIKVYVLFKYMCRNGEKKISQKWIIEQIGLSEKSKNSYAIITNITDSLVCCGFINKRTTREGDKTVNYYSINSVEKWQEIKKSNINRTVM